MPETSSTLRPPYYLGGPPTETHALWRPRSTRTARQPKSVRPHFEVGLSNREIARGLSMSHSTVNDLLGRFQSAALAWPLPEDLDEAALEADLYSGNTGKSRRRPELQRHVELGYVPARTGIPQHTKANEPTILPDAERPRSGSSQQCSNQRQLTCPRASFSTGTPSSAASSLR